MKLISQISISLIPLLGLSACALINAKANIRPIDESGNFQLQMNMNVGYVKNIKQYPVSGHILNDVPFVDNQVIPAGTGLLGIYKNNGFSCTILWTAIVPDSGQPISNSNGVAISKCPVNDKLYESNIISAKWN